MESAKRSGSRRLHWSLLIFLSAFAFLLASFPARNSELWMHLASGRRIAEGHFSLNAADSRLVPDLRVSRTWLYDLTCYAAYTTLGGSGLVVLKALLIVVLALVIWRLSRLRGGLWLSAVGTILALVAMGPRLLVQPSTVSYLLFALCLWIALRRDDDTTRRPSLVCWPLVLLFLVWADIDSGFVIGLATIALIWLGQILDDVVAARARFVDIVRQAVSWAILAAVCLVNPRHIHAFIPPPAWLRFTPSWSSAVPVTLHAAYFSLLGLGVLVFALNLRGGRWERFLPWLGLALLSAWQVRLVPFFSVLAAPLLAWNVQEILLAARPQHPAQTAYMMPRPLHRSFRVVGLLLAGSLLLCVWPGWLVGPPYEPRRWTIETTPSLQRGAQAVRTWHEEERLGSETRALHFSPETAYAFAWFCPQENGVVDEQLTSAILGTGALRDWREQMRSAGINHLVVYDPDRARSTARLSPFLADTTQWPLLYLEGDLAIFGWRDPARLGAVDAFQGWELDLNRLAFYPAPEKMTHANGPDPELQHRHFWDVFWKPVHLWSVDAEEARIHLLHAQILERQSLSRHAAAWQTVQSAGLVASAAGWSGPGSLIDIDLRFALNQSVLPQSFVLQRDDVPPAVLYLGIRAARRALAVNPDDAQAHFTLGECYLRLLNRTRERLWAPQMSQIGQLRLAQASVALNRALALRPDLVQAHEDLGHLYRELDYADLALDHMRAHAKLVREAGPPPGISAAQFREQQAQTDEELRLLGKTLEEQQQAWATESAGGRIMDRVTFAMRRGLAGKVLEMLLESDVSAFGTQGMALEFDLLLMTGRANDVRMWTDPTQAAALGTASYHWLRARALAALGEYQAAKDECTLTGVSGRRSDEADPRQQMALMIGRLILDESSRGGSVVDPIRRGTAEEAFLDRIEELAGAMRQEADATVMRGLLALEEGDMKEAETAFRSALTMWKSQTAAASGSGLEFKGRKLAQGYLDLLK